MYSRSSRKVSSVSCRCRLASRVGCGGGGGEVHVAAACRAGAGTAPGATRVFTDVKVRSVKAIGNTNFHHGSKRSPDTSSSNHDSRMTTVRSTRVSEADEGSYSPARDPRRKCSRRGCNGDGVLSRERGNLITISITLY